MEVKAKIRNFILENFLFTDDESMLADDSSFMETGIIDSTGIIEVMSYLEEEFSIEISPEEMVPENLDSVSRITDFVGAKLGAT